MSLFSKLSKSNDKTLYPWSQKKLGGTNNALPRFGHAAVSISSDAIIVYGGIHRGSIKKDLLQIDTNSMSANSISTTGDVPSSRISSTMLYINGHILHTKQWNRLTMEGAIQPTERSGHSCVIHEGIIYIWGGQRDGRYFNDLFLFNISSAPRWEQLSYDTCPEPRAGHISAVYKDKMFIFGGTNGNKLFNDLWSFDLQTGIWVKIEAEGIIPVAREGCASAMVDDVIYILGGKGENGVELNDLCAYKINGRRWFTFQNMGPQPSPRHGLTMSAIRERLFVIGGDNEISKMEDGSLVYILDSTKIKYPVELPAAQPSIEEKNTSQQPMDNITENQYYQQQQYQQQYSPQPYHHQQQTQPSHNSLHDPSQSYPQPQPSLSQQQQVYSQQTHRSQQQTKYQTQYNSAQRSTQPSPQPPSQRSSPKITLDPTAPYSEPQQPSPTSTPRHRSYYPETQPPARPPRHMSTVPEAALRRPRAGSSPHPPPDLSDSDARRPPMLEHEEEARATPQTAPPRPPREGIRIDEEPKTKMNELEPAGDDKERQMLLREIKARDAVISEMKKKESWWRTEVSLARKLRSRSEEMDSPEDDEALLMDVDHLPEDRLKLFEQLVSVKSELRRVRASILQQASPMSEKVQQADRMRTAALQEAAYFKSKYLALKARRHEELGQLDLSRSDELEKRLAAALAENEAGSKTLLQLQKRSQHDQAARLATEERAREAQERAEEAQQAHQRALEELQAVYARATKAESQARENAIKIADLTQQLSQALLVQPAVKSQEVSEAQLKASQLEAANLKARNESAALKQKLAESMDDIARLRTSLNEREDALNEARLHLEDYEIQLNMLRDAMNQKSSVNGFAPTPAY
ncbi:hypothetical protein G6F60_008060 [Rhizopus arrhizus]|nr:hypothetical protein G6F61_001349 [Rhizopus arrhizus]KAG1398910.1 hypothetical protein G6F60_008060 [Rhizopus arrhizus]